MFIAISSTSTEFIPWQIQLCYCFILSASFHQCSTVTSTKFILWKSNSVIVELCLPLQQSPVTSSFSDKSNCVIVELCLIASASAAQSPVQTPFFDKIQLCCCFIAFDWLRQWSTVTSTEFIPWQIQLSYCVIVSASFRQCSTVASTKSILSQIQRSYCFIAFDYFRQSSTVTNNEFIPWQIQQVQRLSMTNPTVIFFSCVWLLLPVQ